MSEVVEQLAELTGYKDRDVMDVTLVMALRDLLNPLCVSIYRAIGSGEDQRWMSRAHMGQGETVPTADSLVGDISHLPPLAQYPARLACLQRRELRESASASEFTCHFPLISEHDGDGVLEVVTRTRITPAEQRTVSAILRVFHNFQGLLDYSERDSLTGLLNRKTFDASFLKLLRQEEVSPGANLAGDRRHDSLPSYWLGVIDIDHFKRVNDNFGHLIGDEVLLLLSRLMRTSFRYHDRLYRFGGEEFVALIRCDATENALLVFERLRQQCEAFAFPQVGQVTLSIGCTRIRALDTPAAAFDRADKAVYHAKHNGRNQVHGFEQLVEAGHLVEEQQKDSDVELF
ncbi:diguanylate cyclase (GGDEF)-like protein [Inhella inkyongensis]|uniref:diguanylate cyclase n=1 Tax=Inhella inkyongensis TaxID=392593 RepID=A0A840RZT9_9BURK|nr:GGDEF domain-containing protein [Inhella inkyongensis]MBB5203515.1 diguanylate cyclase (GGDEF)-like protein [Inhella inkyongensis]